MKTNWPIVLVAFLAMMAARNAAADIWETDYAKAAATAKSTNRYLLLDFSGSDWCGWCMKLDKEVFSKPAFKQYAKENLVCVLVDFPRRKALPRREQTQNQKLADQYSVRGYPTVIVLSPDGQLVAQTGYQDGGADHYVEHLKGFIDPNRQQNHVPPPTATSKGAPQSQLKPLAVPGHAPDNL